MTENLVLDLSMQFAIDIVNLCETLKGKLVLLTPLKTIYDKKVGHIILELFRVMCPIYLI